MVKKYLKIIVIVLLMLPISIFADTLKVSCGSTKLEPNKETACTITGTTTSAVSSVSAKLKSSGNIKISNIVTNSIWQGDGEGGNIDLYTDSNKTGTFNIATFNVTATSEGTGTISVSNITFSDANFEEKNVSATSLNITVAKKEVTPTPTPTPAPTPTPTPTETKKDSSLKSLTISPGIINFNKGIYNYNVEVEEDVKEVSIKAVATDSTSKVSIPSNLKLTGDSTIFKIVVTASDKSTSTYTIKVTKKISEQPVVNNSANIKIMSIEGIKDFKFDPNTTEYNINTDSSKLVINVVLEDMTSSYKILGNDNLKNGDTILIQVNSNDGTTKDYKLHIIKVEPKNEEVANESGKLIIPNYVFIIAEVLWVILLILYIKSAISKRYN